jgi:hypothetical protein
MPMTRLLSMLLVAGAFPSEESALRDDICNWRAAGRARISRHAIRQQRPRTESKFCVLITLVALCRKLRQFATPRITLLQARAKGARTQQSRSAEFGRAIDFLDNKLMRTTSQANYIWYRRSLRDLLWHGQCHQIAWCGARREFKTLPFP